MRQCQGGDSISRIVFALVADDRWFRRNPRIRRAKVIRIVEVEVRICSSTLHVCRRILHRISDSRLRLHLPSPGSNTRSSKTRERDGTIVPAIHRLLTNHTEVSHATNLHVGIARTLNQRPSTGPVARDGSVLVQRHVHHIGTLKLLIVQLIFVQHKLIIARYFILAVLASSSNAIVRERFPIEFERCHAKPTMLIQEHLMHTVLESLVARVETSVINQETASLAIHERRIVPLRHFCHRLKCQSVECRHQQVSPHRCIVRTIVHLVAVVDGCLSLRIHVRTFYLLRTETAHHVTLLCRESTIRHEEIVVLANVLDVTTLARRVIPSSNADAVVRVARGTVVAISLVGISGCVVAETILVVQLNQPDATAPRTIRHPELPFLIVEHTWVDIVRPVVAPSPVTVVACRQRGLRTNHELQVRLLPVDARIRTVVEARKSHGSLIHVRTLDVVGGQQHNHTAPVITVQTQVLAPFLHVLVPNHVGSPHHASHRRAVRRHPCLRIEIAKRHFCFHTVLQHRHLLRLVRHESILKTCRHHLATTVHHTKQSAIVHARPVHQVRRSRNSIVRTKDIVAARTRIHDGRVVHTHSTMAFVSTQLSHFRSCHCGLCLHGK